MQRKAVGGSCWLCVLCLVLAVQCNAQLVISEFLASNNSTLRDQDGRYSDWIEIHNAGTNAVNLGGWFLTDDDDDLRKWKFPATNLTAGAYLVVFASGTSRTNVGAPLHTGFSLNNDGEYLALVRPDGQTVEFAYSPIFPSQSPDVSYGLGVDGPSTSLVASGAATRILIPSDDIGTAWRSSGFDDSGWRQGAVGVGYDIGTAYDSLISSDVQADMQSVRATAYLRIPFTVEDPSIFNDLVLRMRYDDGFILYLNGQEVKRTNAPAAPTWFSAATASHSGLAVETVNLTGSISLLVPGTNLLAIHGMNVAYTDPDFLMLPELAGRSVRVDPDQRYFFATPSPGGANDLGYVAVTPPPVFTPPGGVFTNANVQIQLTTGVPDVEIRYTVNGSLPDRNSLLYTGPIFIAGSTMIRARAYRDGYVPSIVVSQTCTLLGSDVLGFSSNLPLVILNTFGKSVNESALTAVSSRFIAPLGGRAALTQDADFDGRGGIAVRGSSSLGFPKKSYKFETWDEQGGDEKVSILDFPAESDWVLYAPYTDKTLMRDVLAYRLHEDMGRYAVRTRFVEMFVDTSGGRLTMSDYKGVYVFEERIKRDNNRVDIQKLGPADNSEPNITGGYIIKKDRLDPGDSGFTTSRGMLLGFEDPKERELTSAQRSWLTGWMNQFETALYGANFRDPINGYAKYIDVPSFLDQHWIVEMSKNIDGYRLSNYMHKDRLGKLAMDPIWDWNLSFGNADYAEGWKTNGWYGTQVGDSDYPWFRRLFQDPDFNQKYIDRWGELRRGLFATTNVLARVDALAGELSEAQVRNYQRWPILGQYVWPNWYIGQTYADEVNWMKQWTIGRLAWIDSNYLPAPAFSAPGGPITPGFQLLVSAPLGTIYYTLDGSDPRLSGGAISSRAAVYSSRIALSSNARVFARARYTNAWSPFTAATFVVTTPPLILTELMFHPPDPPVGSAYTADDFEFIELKNVGSTPLNLTGFHFTAGIEFTFTGNAVTNLVPGERVVAVKNTAAFQSRYGNGPKIAGQFLGSLENAGERLALAGALEEPILDFTYNDTWYATADGLGFSLNLVDESTAPADWDTRSAWRPSAVAGGSPGAGDVGFGIPTIWINEVLTHTDPPQIDSIELYNPGTSSVAVKDWYLTDDRHAPKKFRIPAGPDISGGGYRILTENDFNATPGQGSSFTLSSHGEEVYLFSGDSAGNLTGYSHGFSFGAAANGVSFGRYVTSSGEADFPASANNTLEGANGGPRIGPVVINEIHYHPAPGGDEFVELKNVTTAAVKLYDPLHPTNTWRLEGADFRFPVNSELPPTALALVVNTNPVAFRAKYGVPPSVAIYGPYAGNLQGSGERLALQRSDPPDIDTNTGAIFIPYIDIDVVRYNDKPPWPTNADGFGASLERVNSAAYGNDPANWRNSAGPPSPGVINTGNRAPVIDAGPDVRVIASSYPVVTNLLGSATDDGLPNPPGAITAAWSQIDGPAQVAFGNATQLGTSVSLPAPGFYVLRLTVNDADLIVSDDVTLTIDRPAAPVTLVARGSVWKYWDNGAEPGTSWRLPDFADSAWPAGPSPLGYGNGDEATVVNFGPDPTNKYITTWFRQPFTVASATAVTNLSVKLLRDDGGVLYLNGTEIFRSNMPDGTIVPSTPAAEDVVGLDETIFDETNVPPSLLITGTNVLAVEIHQVSGASADLSFDLELSGVSASGNQAPLVDAGGDLAVLLPDPLSLNGAASDDGIPVPPGTLNVGWTKFSGGGEVVFTDTASATTEARFGAPGNYVLRLTASDGDLAAFDDVAVTVGNMDIATWKTRHFTAAELVDPGVSGDNADPDGDGQSNLAEYTSGTDPRDAQSCLKIESVEIAGGPSPSLRLRFKAMPSKTYTVLSLDGLSGATWSRLSDISAKAVEQTVEIIAPNGAGSTQCYYRLVTPQMP